ncbi:MAG: SDR family oxidoreductase [Pseudohongiella sp.]|nr:SDR family oxidoreductase [Pseudohongiella sp.]
MTRTVLITGASSGFGKACAERFAAAGDRLILLARRKERLEKLAQQLGENCETTLIAVDITDATTLEKALSSLAPPFDQPDILINNAGLALGLLPAPESDIQDWETMISTNNLALVRMTRLILPGMSERNRGHIINIGSTAGNWPYPGGNVYGATKAFVQQFSRGLRSDVLGKKIKVTNIEPGLAETEFSLVRFKHDKEQAGKVYEGTQPLTAQDVADAVFWVCATPAHVNINSIEMMPLCQAWGPFKIDRTMEFDQASEID